MHFDWMSKSVTLQARICETFRDCKPGRGIDSPIHKVSLSPHICSIGAVYLPFERISVFLSFFRGDARRHAWEYSLGRSDRLLST